MALLDICHREWRVGDTVSQCYQGRVLMSSSNILFESDSQNDLIAISKELVGEKYHYWDYWLVISFVFQEDSDRIFCIFFSHFV